jgi:hypothetical protein
VSSDLLWKRSNNWRHGAWILALTGELRGNQEERRYLRIRREVRTSSSSSSLVLVYTPGEITLPAMCGPRRSPGDHQSAVNVIQRFDKGRSRHDAVLGTFPVISVRVELLPISSSPSRCNLPLVRRSISARKSSSSVQSKVWNSCPIRTVHD